MSTRSYIGIALPSGKAKFIYCHYDGSPEHHAPILLNHYNTVAKVRALIKLGALSVLGKELGQVHDYNTRYKNPQTSDWCCAYRRDRGESEGITAHTVGPLTDMDNEYNYLFKDKQWWLVEDGKLTDLRAAHITEALA